MNVKDLTKEPPRSPRERIAGYALLARCIDKCRSEIAETPGVYHYNCPLDRYFFDFTHIDSDEFKTFIATGVTDDQIAEWVTEHSSVKSENDITVWSDERESFDATTAPYFDWFAGELVRLGLPEGTTQFTMLEADDANDFS